MPGLTNMTVQWTAPADDGVDPTTGRAAEYDLRFYNGVMTETNWPMATKAAGIEHKAPATPGTPEEFVVQGLRAGDPYSIALKTKDGAGNWSGLSNVLSVIPPDKNPPANVGDLKVKA